MSQFGDMRFGDMKVKYKDSIGYRATKLIEQIPHRVVLREDFVGLGGYRQISRVLRKFIDEKKLVKIGFGVYAKAYQSRYVDEPLVEESPVELDAVY